MKLQARLGWGAAAIIACTLASTLTAHMRMLHIIHVAQGVDHQGWPLVDSMSRLHIDLAESVMTTQQALLDAQAGASSRRSSILSDQDNAIDADVKHIYELSSGAESGGNFAAINALLGQVQEIRKMEGQIVGSLSQQGPSAAAAASATLQSQLLPATNAFTAGLSQAADTERRTEEEKVGALYNADQSVIVILWLASICATVATVVTTVLLGRHLLRTIRLTAARAQAIAAGDLTGGPLVTGSNDELGELASTLQLMQDHLARLIGTVANTAGTLTGSAASMRMASDQIHRRVDQQSQQTRQAATAMQEMSASIAEVSRHTQSAAETARNAAHTAREGGAIVRNMLDTMHSIAEAVTETSTTVGVLGDDSKRISQIVTVIDEIARKTNLLALNAAIEAARAGEQGRGFAVVAGEVRRLAESTAQATSEIGAMIRGIQDRTRSAIASMESGTGTVKQGVETTNQAGEALERIIGMADTVDRMITQIAIAAQQQAAASDQSAASLESIHTLSQENLSAMSTTSVGVESLRETAMSLEGQVERFRVPGSKIKKMSRTGQVPAGSFASSLA